MNQTTMTLPLPARAAGSDRPQSWQIALALGTVYVLWGSTYLAIRFAVDGLPPFLMSGCRHLLAGVLLFAWSCRQGVARPTASQWKAAATVGALLLLGGNGGVVWSEIRIPSGLTAVMVATVPLWMICLNWVRPGGSRPTGRVLCGLFIGFLGTCLLAGPIRIAGSAAPDPLGIGVVAFASLCWAAGSVYARGADLPADPLLATSMEMMAGGVLLLLASTAVREHVVLASVSMQSWGAMLYLIVFGSLIGFSAYSWLLKSAPTDTVATYAYVNPVIALFLGWWVGGEVLNLRTMLAAGLVLIGVVFIVARPRPAGPED